MSTSVEQAWDRWREIDQADTSVGLRSILAMDPDAVGRTARLGVDGGPLDGVAVIVKDNIEAEGLPCTAGSLALDGVPVPGDSPLAARLRRAGAVIVGAANLSEWANIRSTASSSGWSAVGGLTSNPWSLDRSPGGSSAGSGAAVAAGVVRIAIGTETDGSITCPAALNGVVGIKPTVGSVPIDGIVPVSGSQDTPGPLARTVDEAALALAVISADPGLPARSDAVDPGSLRLGVVDAWMTGHGPTDNLFGETLTVLERIVGSLTRPKYPVTPDDVHADEYTVLVHELRTDLDAYLARRVPDGSDRPRSLAEVVEFNTHHAEQELTLFGQDIFERAAACAGRGAPEYAEVRRRNLDWARSCFDAAFADADLLVAPAYTPAWKTDFVLGHRPAGGAVTTPAAIAGLPIVTIPMGLVAGLPVGVSFVGAAGSEDVLIAVAKELENRLGLVDDLGWAPRFTAPSRG